MAGFALRERIRAHITKEARTRRASFAYSMKTCCYARARQWLALLFARLLVLPASTKPHAESAVEFRLLMAKEGMAQLEQIIRRLASAGTTVSSAAACRYIAANEP